MLDLFKSSQSVTSTVNVAPESAEEKQFRLGAADSYGQLGQMVGAGPGQQDVTAALGSTRDLASMLQSFAKGGFLPGQEDITTAQNFAQQMFAPQQTALQQSFQDQQTQANRMAAQMGRGANDPILAAKLAQEQTRQQGMLSAQQGAFAADFGMQLPGQRLGFQEQLANVRSGLATQAMQNRQSLFSMGQQAQQAERNWRLNTASRTNTQTSGGDFMSAVGGISAIAGAGFGIAGGLQSLQAGGLRNQMMQQGLDSGAFKQAQAWGGGQASPAQGAPAPSSMMTGGIVPQNMQQFRQGYQPPQNYVQPPSPMTNPSWNQWNANAILDYSPYEQSGGSLGMAQPQAPGGLTYSFPGPGGASRGFTVPQAPPSPLRLTGGR